MVGSDIYKEADWLMNEAGSIEAIRKVQGMVGKDTHLITCMALWNGQDAAAAAVPEALAAGVGLYGFTAPTTGDGLIPLGTIFARQVCELTGDPRSIAVLARAYQGMSVDALWKDGKFVEPASPPPFHIALQGRGRGMQDTASISYGANEGSVTINTPHNKGRGTLTRKGAQWPATVTIRLQRNGQSPTSTKLLLGNGKNGFSTSLDGSNQVASGATEGGLILGEPWGDKFQLKPEAGDPLKVTVNRSAEAIQIVVPPEITKSNPEVLAFEWN